MIDSIAWRILFAGWVASEVYVALATRTKRSSGRVQDRGSQLMLWIVIGNAVTACEWIAGSQTPTMFGGAHWLKTASLLVLLAGLAVRWAAILTLGKSFSANVAIQESQTVHKSGLYRVVRHPSYLGMLMVFAAIGLHSRNWLALAIVMVPTTAALLYRIRIEEAVLRQAFGDEYAAYSRATKRLIPGVY